MVIGDRQGELLGEELRKLAGYGRTELELTDTDERGKLTLRHWGYKGRRLGWVLFSEVTIGAQGKITRRELENPGIGAWAPLGRVTEVLPGGRARVKVGAGA